MYVAPGANHPSLYTDDLRANASLFSFVDRRPDESAHDTFLRLAQSPKNMKNLALSESTTTLTIEPRAITKENEKNDQFLSTSSSLCSLPSSGAFLTAPNGNLLPSTTEVPPRDASLPPLGPKIRCVYRVRHRQDLASCWVTFEPHDSTSGARQNDNLNQAKLETEGADESSGSLRVWFDEPMRAVTVGQHLVLYWPRLGMAVSSAFEQSTASSSALGDEPQGRSGLDAEQLEWAYECIGGGIITQRGGSYWERNKQLPANVRSWAMS